MAHECSICYADCAKVTKLSCSHEFCGGCIKTWYQKGTGTGCPMCRRPVYFKGFHKIRDEWNREAYEAKAGDVFSENLDSYVAEAVESLEEECENMRQAETVDEAQMVACELVEGMVEDMRILVKFWEDVEEFDTIEGVVAFTRAWFFKDLMQDIVKMDRTFRVMKHYNADPEAIDESMYYMDYYSDRDLGLLDYEDEPVKEWATQYPKVARSAQGGTRARALEDEWSTMTFILVL